MKVLETLGATSRIWQLFIADSSSTTGAGLTGLVFNSGSLTCYYHRDTDTTATAVTLVTMTVGTFTSSGFKEIDATNMPGWYQFCPPNAVLASGAKSVAVHLKGATNMAPLPIEVQLVAFDTQDATALGLSRLDAAVTTRMATYTQPTGFLAATFPTSVASPTNITAGTITTVTNLTNAPTAGDFTATMKTSIGTAVAASAVASVTGAVGSVTGNVGGNVNGNVVGSVASVTARVTANTDQLAGQTVTAGAGVTFPSSVASPTNITGGVITTVTNLTNAPTAGDFTATMKTSLGTAVAASAVASVTAGVTLAANAVDATALATSAATEIATAVVGTTLGADYSNLTVANALQVQLAVLGGKVSGAAVGAPVFRSPADTKDVVTATDDTNGNRTAVTLTP